LESWILIFLRSLFAALLVLVLPGYAVIAWRPEPEKDPLQRLALALGLSFSLNALLALIFFEFHWPLSGRGGLVFYAVAGGTALAGWLVNRPFPRPNSRAIALIALFAALIAWRFFQVRGLAFPPWVDAPHHVLIIRTIMETGILPADLNPYLPVTFYYHFGFHVVTALFAGISGLPLERAALGMGQILNAAVSLSVYSLGRVLWSDPRRAGVAALLTALVSQMPAYYATWGRYTLISGLVLLPLAMAVLLENRESGRDSIKIIFQMILVAGTVLAHYFAGFLLLLFVLVFFGEGIGLAYAGKGRWSQILKVPLAGFLGGLVLIVPWLLTIRSPVKKFVGVALTPFGPSMDQVYFQGYGEYLFHLLGPWRNYCLLAGALVGCFWALRDSRIRAIAVWGLLLSLGILSWGFRLFPFRPDHFAIILFLPACLIVCHGAFEILDGSGGPSGKRKGTEKIGLMILGLFCLWGLVETATIIRPVTVFAGADDLRAIHWVKEKTPPESRFLINVTPWEWNLYRGTDGGWWITPLTGRWTSLPTLFYGFGEEELIEEVNRRAVKTLQTRPGEPNWWRLIREEGITHIYSHSGAEALPPESLLTCPGLKMEYRHGQVYIFKIS
jgi:hypothetical protein